MNAQENEIQVAAKITDATAVSETQTPVVTIQHARFDAEATFMEISLDQLIVPDYHPRSSKEDIDSLVDSIKREGMHTPLTVMKDQGTGQHIILDGFRRKKALEKLGVVSAPCIMKSSANDADAAHVSYVMNMERKAINPVEQALHLKKMIDDFGYTLQDLSIKGYGTAPSISNKLKNLELSKTIQEYVIGGKLTESHGRKLLKLKTVDEQERMAKRAIEANYSVSILGTRIASYLERGSKKKPEKVHTPNKMDPDIEGVYFKDSRDMSEIPEKAVHFIMGSPPYTFGYEFEKDYTFSTMWDEIEDVFKECGRVLVPGGIVAINFTDMQDFVTKRGNGEQKEWLFTGPLVQKAFKKHNIILTDVIQWVKPVAWQHKLNTVPKDTDPHTSYRVIRQTEQIFILRKKGERETPNAETMLRSHLSKEQRTKWCPNAWNIHHVQGQNLEGHPCVYPAELCDRLIRMFSYEGDTVLDPWLGSGTTVKVARELNRVGLGYERELKYKPVIMKKLELTKDQPGEMKPSVTMQEYYKESRDQTKLQTPDTDQAEPEDVAFITNMTEAEMAYMTYSPSLPS